MSKSAITEFLQLPAVNSAVTISIRVGNSQSGTITFNESGKGLIQKEGSLSYTAQSSDALDGKSFDFNIVCVDVNASSDNLVVNVELTGVSNDGPWTLSKSVSKGGTFQFFGSIEFFK
ncbi:MAG: hypothetical protein Crog4KO_21350 [Crocinitomicaceae bacterium]